MILSPRLIKIFLPAIAVGGLSAECIAELQRDYAETQQPNVSDQVATGNTVESALTKLLTGTTEKQNTNNSNHPQSTNDTAAENTNTTNDQNVSGNKSQNKSNGANQPAVESKNSHAGKSDQKSQQSPASTSAKPLSSQSAAPKQNTPKPSTSKSTTPKSTVPKQSTPQQSTPQQTTPKQHVSTTPKSNTNQTASSANLNYDRTTKIYADDEITLLRIEYYLNNKLVYYSRVTNFDANTKSYTEKIYQWDYSANRENLIRTDVYSGGKLVSSY